MAQVKKVRVDAIVYNPFCRYYAWTAKEFKTFTDDNGNKTYFINDKQVTKEEGNKEYKRLKSDNAHYQTTEDCKKFIKREWKSYHNYKNNPLMQKQFPNATYTLHEADTFKQEVEEYEVSYEELIEKLEKSIDRYVEYIDDGKQYRQAVERNREISRRIEELNKLIAERR